MTKRLAGAVMIALAVATGATCAGGTGYADTITAPGFGTVTIYQPDTSPQQVVLFLSGDGGWNLGVIGMAERLRRAGALVVGIDIRAFVKSLESSVAARTRRGTRRALTRRPVALRCPTTSVRSWSATRRARRWSMPRSPRRRRRHLPARSAWAFVPVSSSQRRCVPCAA